MNADLAGPAGCASLRWMSGLVTVGCGIASGTAAGSVSCAVSQGPDGSEVGLVHAADAGQPALIIDPGLPAEGRERLARKIEQFFSLGRFRLRAMRPELTAEDLLTIFSGTTWTFHAVVSCSALSVPSVLLSIPGSR